MFRIKIRPFTCEIYVDGRIHCELPTKPSIMERGTAIVLQKMADAGKFKPLDPGRYRVISTPDRGGHQFEMTPIS